MCLNYDMHLNPRSAQLGPPYKIVRVLEKHEGIRTFIESARAAMATRCDLCGGGGHRGNKCASRYALDAAAKDLGIGWEWGAAKSAGYYRQYLAAEAN